jgi:hypothetical protein
MIASPGRSFIGAQAPSPKPWMICLGLTALAFVVHGYHPFAEDAGIYIPAIKQHLDPSLYPYGQQFVSLPANLSVFTRAVALSVRVLHLPLTYTLLLWYLSCLFLTTLACWRIAVLSTGNRVSGWIGASLVAACMTMPAAGCSLLLFDPYVTSRTVSTPLLLLCIASFIASNYRWAAAWWVVAAAFHPLMAAITLGFLFALWMVRRPTSAYYAAPLLIACIGAGVLASMRFGSRISPAYRDAVLSRSYFFLSNWAWYEILGAVAPILFFGWMAFANRRKRNTLFEVSLAATIFGALALTVSLAICLMPMLFSLSRLQPMRAFQLIYFLMLLLPISVAFQHLVSTWPLRRMQIALTVIVLSVAGGMFWVQRETFAAGRHIEWPWSPPTNPWQQAFAWIHSNTPKDALFALSPDYADDPLDDRQGFRANAERSTIPDRTKDGGVVAVLPQLAKEWKAGTEMTANLQNFDAPQLNRLRTAGVTWIVIRNPGNVALTCPYANPSVLVCRLAPSNWGGDLASKESPR